MNTQTNETLIEDDGDEKEQNNEYVAVEQDDERVEAHADDGDDDGDDERLDADNEDREELRRRRREEKAERSQRRKAAIERDKNELAFLRQKTEEQERRLAAIEHRSASHDFASLNQRLKDTQEEVKAAEYVIAKATEAGNGEDVVAAMRVRDEAIDKLRQLSALRNRSQPAQEKRQQPEPQAPAHQQLAQDWVKMNPWFDPQGSDERSKRVLQIDQTLTNEGYNPLSLEYWRELDKRVGVDKKSRGGPPIGSGRERASAVSKNEVYISPERKQAMIDAGVWDDKNARQRYLKAYSEWDRNNNATR